MKIKKRVAQLYEMFTLYLAVLTLIPLVCLLGLLDWEFLSERDVVLVLVALPITSVTWFLFLPSVRKTVGEENLEMLPHMPLILKMLFIWLYCFPANLKYLVRRLRKVRQ